MQSTGAKMASWVFLLSVAAAGVWLVVFPPESAPAEATGTPTMAAAPTPAAPPTVAATPTACAPQAAVEVTPEQVVLTSYDTTWYRMGTVLAPSSATGGPLAGDPASNCFARTPEGALYAIATRQVREANAAGVSGWRFTGYRWNQFTPELATVTIAVGATTGGGEAARAYTALWQNNDWQVVAPTEENNEPIDSLRTFTPWGG
jgi:hypothetical protein